MIKCPFCQTIHVDNTLFCSECGTYLLEEEEIETSPLDIAEKENAPFSFSARTPAPATEGTAPKSIRLSIGRNRRIIELPLHKVAYIGRVDPASTIFPELDLTNDGAIEYGISRRHARILQQGNTVVVEDLGSINGTFVNGERLAPYLPEVLQDGDTLLLGQLKIHVSILLKE